MSAARCWTHRYARLRVPLLALLAALGMASCGGKRETDAAQKMTMRPSITYLHLLQHTPFFTALSRSQLQWVIDHSREWEADTGAVIAKCNGAADPNAPYWILLDGGWQIEYRDKLLRSGNAESGKWFSAADANAQSCSLVVNEHSYVMRIQRSDMQQMLDRGFGFHTHIDSGASYYREIFYGRQMN
ncbi:hypothetical protein [Paraburkholderia azotifigens]|uniref:Uncharacterized protein n=1 Tax=Paraburkholderia azotifigens TaxID=2057004 RepID=A0A5C6VES1_9BURK|nr:hypothetical protein [Paraburkholderia azotifigens]TXC83707.1 hypothetical protein FRZ40_25410 [Paraburkholderia azotifigens]